MKKDVTLPDEFRYDVFLSHSAKDKAVMRPPTERLRADGLLAQFRYVNSRPTDREQEFTSLRIVRFASETFPVGKPKHVRSIAGAPDGRRYWMDASAYLKRESAGGKAVKQIVFTGERFDVMSVRRWREKVLGAKVT